MDQIGEQCVRIRAAVAAACRAAGRDVASVRVIAVGKRFPAAALQAAYAAGCRDFGENYASELIAKVPQLPADVLWHVIGPLQRRPVAKLPAGRFVLHTLDRMELVERLLQVFPDALPPTLIEVNIGAEPQKAGVAPAALDAFVEAVRRRAPGLPLQGLMAIPPAAADPEASRPFFAQLRALGDRLRGALGVARVELSMGMSDDFPVAIAEGATMVRIGTGIFGPRQAPVDLVSSNP